MLLAHGGDQATYDELTNRFETTKEPFLRSAYLRSLGYFKQPEIIDQALEYTLGSHVLASETTAIPRDITRTEAGRDKVFRWLEENYETVAGRIPDEYLSYLPLMFRGCSVATFEQRSVFFADPEHRVPGTEANLEKALDEVRDCQTLRKREGETVREYLSRYE